MIQIDEIGFASPRISKAKSDSGVEGVRYRRHLNRPIQMISAEDFESARSAIRRLDDPGALDSIRQAHPEWPSSVVYAQAFLYHYERSLGET